MAPPAKKGSSIFRVSLNFFNEAELEQDPEAAKAKDLEALLPEKTAKKQKARATDAERFREFLLKKKYLELSEEEKLCPVCGTPLKEIGGRVCPPGTGFCTGKTESI